MPLLQKFFKSRKREGSPGAKPILMQDSPVFLIFSAPGLPTSISSKDCISKSSILYFFPQGLSKWPKWEIRKVGIFSHPPGLTSSSHTLPAHAGHQSALWPWGLLTYPKKFQQILEQRRAENEMPCLDWKSLRLAREGCKIPFEMLQIFSLLLLISVTFLFQPPPPNRFMQHLYKLKCDL